MARCGSSVGGVFTSSTAAPRSTLASQPYGLAHSFVEKICYAVSKRASCLLLAKEWALDTGKLPLGQSGRLVQEHCG